MPLLQKNKWLDFLDHAVEYSLYGLIVFLPFSKSGVEICFSLSLAFFLAKKILRPDLKFLKAPHHVFLLLFFAFSCLSLFNSAPYFYKSLRALLSKWMEWILIFLIAEDTFSEPAKLRNSVVVLLSVSVLMGIDGLSQRFLGVEFLMQREPVWINQGFYGITAAFEHYNSFGTYLTFVLLPAIALLLFGRFKNIYRLGLFFIVILAETCLLLTFSRGSWIGFMAGLAVMLVLSRKRLAVFLFVALFMILLVTLPVVRERAFFIFQKYGASERFALVEVSWRMVRENIFFGKGVGTFMDYCSLYTSGSAVKYAHNCYLQILAETGVLALGSFLMFLGMVLYRVAKSLKGSFDCFLLGLLSAISGFLTQSFFDVQLYSLQLAALFWFFLGVMAGAGRAKDVTGDGIWKKSE